MNELAEVAFCPNKNRKVKMHKQYEETRKILLEEIGKDWIDNQSRKYYMCQVWSRLEATGLK